MSLIAHAERELAKWDADERDTMLKILKMFFDTWDSGGAVSFAAPALQRLIAGKPLGPLTGEDDEWVEVGPSVFQNARCSSVFKDPRFHDGKLAYDIDAAEPRAAIEFPYWPDKAEVKPPVITL